MAEMITNNAPHTNARAILVPTSISSSQAPMRLSATTLPVHINRCRRTACRSNHH